MYPVFILFYFNFILLTQFIFYYFYLFIYINDLFIYVGDLFIIFPDMPSLWQKHKNERIRAKESERIKNRLCVQVTCVHFGRVSLTESVSHWMSKWYSADNFAYNVPEAYD